MNEHTHFAYFSTEPQRMHAHYHDCHQILLILKGKIEVCVNGIPHYAASGNLVIFSRYENHSIQILSPEYERYVLQIDPFAGKANKIYALLANRPEGFQNILDVSADIQEFQRLFSMITQEVQGSARMHADMLELLIQQLLIRIYRQLPPAPVSLEDNHFSYILELQHRFEANCRYPYTLESLANTYNVSPSTLSHQFKKMTGASVMDYLQSCRMALAKKYLTETSMSVSKIVDLCGFSDNSNFSRAFKKQNGMSPSRFRAFYSTLS